MKRKTPLSVANIVRRCRKRITESLPALIDQWIAATSLPRSSRQFQVNVTQFQVNVTRAIVSSVALLSDAPKRKRFSILRSEMSRVEKAASSAAKALHTVQSALDELTPLYRNALHSWPRFEKFKILRWATLDLDALSSHANMYAKGFGRIDKGGAPKMLEFEVLVRSLADAFEKLTGRSAKVTWNEHKGQFEGNFVKLVETILPLAQSCAESVDLRMSCPGTPAARGKYIYEKTRAGRPMSRTSYHVS
jgi:hypothetical protein